MIRFCPAVVLSLSMIACGPLLRLDASSEEVCHKSRQSFVIGHGSTSPAVSPGGDFLVPLGVPQGASGVTVSLRLGTVTLSAPEGVTGFGFIHQAKLSLLPPAGGPMAESAVVELSPATQSATTLQLIGDRGDLSPYLMAGSVKWTAQLETDWQPPPFQADVEVCGEVGLHFEAL